MFLKSLIENELVVFLLQNWNDSCFILGDEKRYAKDPNFKEFVLFYEYFHGDTGRGCGAR